jgi:hypothetical protein
MVSVTVHLRRRRNIADVYFHYCNTRGVLIDRSGTAVDDLNEAREQAYWAVRLLIMTPSAEGWRGGVLHVTHDDGDEIFDVPFAAVLGNPH